jgi:hypothetical protein
MAVEHDEVDDARQRWRRASSHAADLAASHFGPGTGYSPDARDEAEREIREARLEADRLFAEYDDLDRRSLQRTMLELQRSQHRATWASFAVAAVVGTATVLSVVVALIN